MLGLELLFGRNLYVYESVARLPKGAQILLNGENRIVIGTHTNPSRVDLDEEGFKRSGRMAITPYTIGLGHADTVRRLGLLSPRRYFRRSIV